MNTELECLLWAKTTPWKSLRGHLRETATVMKGLLSASDYSYDCQLLSKWLNLSTNNTLALCQYLAAMHDIGKCHPLFQKQEPAIGGYLEQNPSVDLQIALTGYRHEWGSASAARRIWQTKSRFDKRVGRVFSSVLSLHHQGKMQKDYPITENNDWPGAHEWIEQQNSLEQWAFDSYCPPYLEKKQIAHVDAACTIMTGLLIMSDWIASSEMFAGDLDRMSDEELDRKVRDIICGIGLNSVKEADCTVYSELFPWITPVTERPLQTSVRQLLTERTDMPLLMILEAPMGEGKTEAGLFAARRMAYGWHKKGCYVGLPTAATSNQMVGRVEKMLSLSGYSARLLHSMAWLDDSKPSYSDATKDLEGWLMPARRALLSPFAVGTVDQVMMAALRVKYGVLRLLGLTDKVLIIDEVHAYDAYMSSIIERLTEWCRVLCIPVVLLSATLPEGKKQQYLSLYGSTEGLRHAYPLVTAAYADRTIIQREVNESYKHGVVGIRLTQNDSKYETVSRRAIEAVADGGCLCILVNTVKTAQSVYRMVKTIGTDAKVMLFHSRFSAARRQEIENECLKLFGPEHENRPAKAILVATQVVEQSLDLDFDAMITELAPIDLILQRMGRLHRHDDTVRPVCLQTPVLDILLPCNENLGASGLIYHPLLLNRTAYVLKSVDRIVIPDDIPRMVNAVYQSDLLNDTEMENWLKEQFDTDMLTGQAEVNELLAPQEEDFGLAGSGKIFSEDGENSLVAAKTRLGEKAVRIAIVPESLFRKTESCLENEFIPQETARELMRYSVSVSERSVKNVKWADDSLEGIGKIYGMRILLCVGDADTPTATLVASTSTHTIILDREYGLIIQEGGKKNEIRCSD